MKATGVQARYSYTGAVRVVQGLIAKLFGSMSPHMRVLGFQIVSIKGGVCVARVPYSDDLIGDPVTGVLHGGVVTSLLDTTGGAAVLSALGKPLPLATLDLRIDYLRPSRPGRGVAAKVECYKTTYNVAFTRGVAYDDDESDPVASMAGTYMLRTQRFRRSERP
jgi:uncharacterized protein (TIGR00369 family)